ncbi:MAG: SUMF1/EgtB/PvdO family nonheme iron enzyme [Chloroflexi bacterium]|nr:SUMF1/EgtB/PvdO family nonheme iron enzyme [Chloroflexota bacterium]
MDEQNRLQAELEKLEQAIAFQETLRGILDEAQIKAVLSPLHEKRASLLAELSGSGAIAQGEGAQAAGERAVIAHDVGGNVVTGNNVVINADPAQAEAERARIRYLRKLYQRCNALPLAAMGGDEGVGDEVTLDQVYVALDTRTQVELTEEEKRERQERPSMGGRDDTRPLTALEAATQTPYLALLGDPGGGKSTFVRQLAAWLAATCLEERDPLPGWEADLLPVMIALRELAPYLSALDLHALSGADQELELVTAIRQFLSKTLVECKAEAWDTCLEDVLTSGQVLLIFDGLDEVAEAARERVRQAVQALLRAYPEIKRVIVACRVRSYTESVALSGFGAHTLVPFDEDKIKSFVKAWYRVQVALGRLTSDKAAKRVQDLQQATVSAELRELASNPMLLTTMALIHQREIGLPKERVRLYELAVRVLLNRWQQRKGIVVSDPLEAVLVNDLKLRAIMERLAYEAHRRQAQAGDSGTADLPRSDLLLLLEDPAYLDDLGLAGEFLDYVDQRAGLLVGQGGDVEGRRPQTYNFPHRTFQEYLAGCHLLGQRGTAREYWQRAGEGDFWYMAARLGAEELLYNRRGETELLDLAYALSPQKEPGDEKSWRATVWSGQMAALLGRDAVRRDTESPDGGEAYLERLVPRLVQVLRETPLRAVERAEAGNALAKLDDPRFRADAWYLPDEPALSTAEGPMLGFVEIPAGEFLMGSNKQQDDIAYDEQPQHPVELPAYYIARYPVTVAQFDAFVNAGGYQEAGYWTEAAAVGFWDAVKFKGPYDDEPRDRPVDYGEPFNLSNYPVVGVTWYEALAYCRWLTEQLRESAQTESVMMRLLKDGWKVTLASEAEWEKAARGSDGRVYPWGQDADLNRANYSDTGIETTSAVGCFPGGGSPYGIEDLSGNVWEWTRSHWGKDYPYDPADGRENLAAGVNVSRVLRGGSFADSNRDVRCAYRYYNLPRLRSWYYGFRLVVVSPLPPNSGDSGL